MATGILLLAGEAGAALKVATAANKTGAFSWDLELLELHASESDIQNLRQKQTLDEVLLESSSQMIHRFTNRLAVDRLRQGAKGMLELATK